MEPLANISHNENSTAVYFAYINSLLAGAEFEKFCNQTRCTEPVMKLQMVSPTHTHKYSQIPPSQTNTTAIKIASIADIRSYAM